MKPVNRSILEKQNQRQPCDTGLLVVTSGNVRDSGYFLNGLNGGVTNTPLNTRHSQGRKDVQISALFIISAISSLIAFKKYS